MNRTAVAAASLDSASGKSTGPKVRELLAAAEGLAQALEASPHKNDPWLASVLTHAVESIVDLVADESSQHIWSWLANQKDQQMRRDVDGQVRCDWLLTVGLAAETLRDGKPYIALDQRFDSLHAFVKARS